MLEDRGTAERSGAVEPVDKQCIRFQNQTGPIPYNTIKRGGLTRVTNGSVLPISHLKTGT